MELENIVFREALCEPLLNSLVKYNKFAKSRCVDSKNKLFTVAAHGESPKPPPTSSPNRRPKVTTVTGVRHPDRANHIFY